MSNYNDLMITSLDTITAYGVTDGAFLFVLDELQNATINQTEEKSDITGKGGRKLTSLKRNKAVTVSGNNGTLSTGLLKSQTGGSMTEKSTYVQWIDHIKASANSSATTTYKAAGTAGDEIQAVYIKNADGTLGTKLTQDSSVGVGKFTYDNTTGVLAFNSTTTGEGQSAVTTYEVPKDTELVVFYQRQITAAYMQNESDKFSGKAQLYIDATAEDKCANLYHVQFYIPKADFNGEFSIEMGNDQSVHAFEAEALAGGCATGGTLWSLAVFDDSYNTDATASA